MNTLIFKEYATLCKNDKGLYSSNTGRDYYSMEMTYFGYIISSLPSELDRGDIE